ncbi:MAG: NAD(P)/FAD-dependent oxidoreductase [Methanotrichaceae archaeon]|nr:NAD(P)/FAD-dependent oxidoreductase [Methanotrichaceae archaeon]
MKKIVVVGAGISGLLAGLALAKEGNDVTIFEATSEVGGMCRSYEINSFRVDTGPHIITRLKNGPLKELMDKYFDIVPEFVLHGEYYIRANKKTYKFPWTLKAFAFFEPISKKDRLMILQTFTSLYSQRIFNPDYDDVSVGDMVKNRDYDEKTLRIIDTICKFLTGNSMDKTPVARFLDSQDYKNSGGRTSQDPIDYLNSMKNLFTKNGAEDQCYPVGGIISIVKAALSSMPENVDIKLNSQVEKIVVEDDRVSGVVVNGEFISSDCVVYSAYSSHLPKIVDRLPGDYRKNLENLEKVISLTLWLGLDKKFFKNSGSEIWVDSDPSCWVVPVTNYDSSLAPPEHQLVGFVTILPDDFDIDKERSRLLKTIVTQLPSIEKHIKMKHFQVLIPEKAAWIVNQKMPTSKTPIKGLYLVGTDTTHKSMGITRASYSVSNLLEAMKE